jgi:hypothetical protein
VGRLAFGLDPTLARRRIACKSNRGLTQSLHLDPPPGEASPFPIYGPSIGIDRYSYLSRFSNHCNKKYLLDAVNVWIYFRTLVEFDWRHEEQ